MTFDELVLCSIREGMTRVDAEANAREILFGSAAEEGMMRKELNDLDEALWQSCVRLSFEDRCQQVEAAVRSSGGGTDELLRRATSLLEDGLIDESQFEILLARAWTAEPADVAASSGHSAASGSSSSDAASGEGLERAATRLQAAGRRLLARRARLQAVREARAALVVQTSWRASLGRTLVMSTRLDQLHARSELHWAARRVQAASHALCALIRRSNAASARHRRGGRCACFGC